jgi:hypothetical protein
MFELHLFALTLLDLKLELYQLCPWWLGELRATDSIRLVVAELLPQLGGSTIMVGLITLHCSSGVKKCQLQVGGVKHDIWLNGVLCRVLIF